jgi:hypothetical protein
MVLKKPTHKDLSNKIRQAQKALAEGRLAFVTPAVIAMDALELEYEIAELPDVLADLLNRATPEDYAGTSPPQQSYEDSILRSDLFAFRIWSAHLNCTIYLKFSLKDNTLWLVSLHRERGGKRG